MMSTMTDNHYDLHTGRLAQFKPLMERYVWRYSLLCDEEYAKHTYTHNWREGVCLLSPLLLH